MYEEIKKNEFFTFKFMLLVMYVISAFFLGGWFLITGSKEAITDFSVLLGLGFIFADLQVKKHNK